MKMKMNIASRERRRREDVAKKTNNKKGRRKEFFFRQSAGEFPFPPTRRRRRDVLVCLTPLLLFVALCRHQIGLTGGFYIRKRTRRKFSCSHRLLLLTD